MPRYTTPLRQISAAEMVAASQHPTGNVTVSAAEIEAARVNPTRHPACTPEDYAVACKTVDILLARGRAMAAARGEPDADAPLWPDEYLGELSPPPREPVPRAALWPDYS